MRKNPIWWQVFISEYVKNGQNATQAYIKARPDIKNSATAAVMAERLLRKANFALILKEAQDKAVSKIEMSRERWLQLVSDCAGFDIRNYLKLESGSGDVQLVDDWKERVDGHAISEVQLNTTTLESGAVVQRVKLSRESKLKALEILGKALGFLTDKVDVKHHGSIEVINPYATGDDTSKP